MPDQSVSSLRGDDLPNKQPQLTCPFCGYTAPLYRFAIAALPLTLSENYVQIYRCRAPSCRCFFAPKQEGNGSVSFSNA